MAVTVELLAERLKAAIESADLDGVSDLLAPGSRHNRTEESGDA